MIPKELSNILMNNNNNYDLFFILIRNEYK